MLPGILGTKVGMTHVFAEDGKMVPVTVIQAGPVFVTQIKTLEKDKYNAVQVGFGKKSDKSLTFPKYGHLKKAGVETNLRWLREFRVGDTAGFELGQEIKADVLNEGDEVTVVGNPSRVTGEFKALMVSLKRPFDGFSWGGRGEVVD